MGRRTAKALAAAVEVDLGRRLRSAVEVLVATTVGEKNNDQDKGKGGYDLKVLTLLFWCGVGGVILVPGFFRYVRGRVRGRAFSSEEDLVARQTGLMCRAANFTVFRSHV